jgi:hypothetical protein
MSKFGEREGNEMHYVSLSCSAPPPGACGSKVTERKGRADGAGLSPLSTLVMQATDHVQDWSILYGRANGYGRISAYVRSVWY